MNMSKTKTKRIAIYIAVLLLVGLAGLGLGRLTGRSVEQSVGTPPRAVVAETWTCSMHPQIHLPGPGKCPLCGMDLIPVQKESDENLGPRELKLSPYAQKLANVRTLPVERRFVERELRMVGKVVYDESRVKTITAWVPGRLDRLFVDYTGIDVREGDHLVYLYSPDLISAQEELIQAAGTHEAMGGQSIPAVRERAGQMIETAREKLRLLGLTKEQIQSVEEKGIAEDHLTIHAPISGVVVEKAVKEGMYVKTGTPIYTIAELDRVWVLLEAYESDLPWIHYGQKVRFEAEAYPGDSFEGVVAFIDPILDPMTRTVNVRVNVDNSGRGLKPGMFVRSVLYAATTVDGRAMAPELAGKWICPMHPEVVKDGPGTCDVCGMDLVPVESLGYTTGEDAEAPLIIPSTAPLITGRRAVVYVAVSDRDGVFEGREIMLGPRAGDYYIVASGLEEGEEVVVHGAFKIDSAVQILAQPSMMNPEGAAPPPERHGHQDAMATATPDDPPEMFFQSMESVLRAYYPLYRALAADDLAVARGHAASVADRARAAAGEAWESVARAASVTANSNGLAGTRSSFRHLSKEIAVLVRRFGTGDRIAVRVANCPMAFDDRGADWLQPDEDILNPYFGAEMLECGYIKETLAEARP